MNVKRASTVKGEGTAGVSPLLRENQVPATISVTQDRDAVCFAQFAMEHVQVPVYCINAAGRIVFTNDTACTSLGYSAEEMRRLSLADIEPHLTPEEMSIRWRTLRRNRHDRFETHHRTRSGQLYPVQIQANLWERDGEEYACCCARDLRDQRRAERRDLLHQFCMEKGIMGILQLHRDGTIAMANEYACRSLGYSTDELCSMTLFDITPAVTREQFHGIQRQLDAHGSLTIETVHRRRDGSTFPVEITATRVDFHDGTCCISFVRDLTEARKAEQALRDSEEKFRLLTETTLNAVFLISEERIQYANPAATRLCGHTREELRGQNAWMIIHQESREAFRKRLRALQRGEQPPGRNKYRIVTRSGESRWAMASSALLAYGSTPAVMVTFMDITETIRSEEALRESETRLKLAMEMASLVQWEFDVATGMFRLDNQFQPPPGTSQGKTGPIFMPREAFLQKYIHPDDIPAVRNEMELCLGNSGTGSTGRLEHRIIRANGEERHVSVRYEIILDEDGKVAKLCGTTQDITERKRAEEQRLILETQLHQAQKMEAIGQLAGGIAHDFNNILSAIMGFSELMQVRMEDGHPFRHHVKQIVAAVERGAELTQGLLAFSRKQVLNVKCLDLREIVSGMEKMLRRLIPEDIDFRVTTAPTAMNVTADRGQIEQVFMNLVTNARDAMPSGGVLTVEVAPETLDGDFIGTHGFGIPGQYAMLAIRDNGCGMAPETREKIFEPFFTTKGVGRGTGLGLSIIYGIVKQHDGFITVDSLPGVGTTFRIYLPLVEREKDDTLHTGRSQNLPARGSETILLVEDDETVRELNRIVLEESGYRVIETGDGREALDLFRQHHPAVAMLVTDVIMPHLDGKSLYEEIRRFHPGVQVLFMSGYAAETLDARGIVGDGASFLSKPVKPRELLARIRELLDLASHNPPKPGATEPAP